MKKYLLLLRGDPEFWPNLSPTEMQEALERYRAWSVSLHEKNAYVAGDGLEDEGLTAHKSGGKLVITDGPFIEAKEMVGGYYLIQAENLEAARALLEDCPHLDWGSVELRTLSEY
ncbi:hypothetical protein EON79_01290 [bacterium]|nr:MAG: hypothetical protein EON79_01290 [bacterium]